ncbi:MAG: SDR family oxidoreductase [Chloroflexi bacterium]|nr:SDR family oxidoreductase [Chloroflexota bacterium]
MKLQGKSALVTGAGSGIGKAIALLFAAEGAKLLLAGPTQERERAVARQIEDRGGLASFIVMDASVEAQVQAAIAAAVEAYGRLDIVVNNGGVAGLVPWDRAIAVDLSGVYYGCLHALQVMRQQSGGVIINMASTAGLVGTKLPEITGGLGYGYTAAKHGIIGLTRQFALDGAPHGIRVNCLCPGWVDTPLIEVVKRPLHDWLVKSTPLGRLAQPEEIARAALFLASDDSSYMTGAPLTVDGGWTAR